MKPKKALLNNRLVKFKRVSLAQFYLLALTFLTSYGLQANSLNEYEAFFAKKDFQRANDILNILKQAEPNNADLYYRNAQTCMGLKNYVCAEDNAAQAVLKDPTVSKHHSLFADAQVLKFVSTQNVSIIKLPGFARRVKRSYQKAVNLEPTNIKAREGLALYYLMSPKLVGGSVKKAQVQANEIEKIDKLSAYRLNIGILQKRKKMDQALALINEWHALKPEAWEPTESRFYFYYRKKDYSNAAKIVSDWLETHPKEMNANYLLGLVAAVSGDYLEQGEQALLTYNAYTPDMEQPGHEWSYYRLANIYEHKGEMDKAIIAAKQAETLQPNNKKVVKQVRELLAKNE